MGLKEKIYYKVVDFDPFIKSHYEGYIISNADYHKHNRIISWIFLLKLNLFHYKVIKQLPKAPQKYIPRKLNFESNSLPTEIHKTERKEQKTMNTENNFKWTLPEYKAQFRHTVQQLTKICSEYDVVSFDIFDTLIFRYFDKPTDLFDFIELKYDLVDFKKNRIQAEKEARKIAAGHEVTITEIYEELNRIKHINITEVMEYEIQTELEFTYANPYMKKVYDILKRMGKKIIAISNMYLPSNIIEQILQKAGFESFDAVYVSCDYRMSKGDKTLYSYVEKKYIKGRKVLHIGDNYKVDFLNAKDCGWQAYHYPNCTVLSDNYRPKWKYSIASSLYKGIISHEIHSGMRLTYTKNKYYEYGFIYGGILVCGFCEYLDKLAKEKSFDKYIFLARDGDIIQKVYNKHFNVIENDYMVWSRFLSTYLCLNEGVSELFMRNINPVYDMVPGATVETILTNIHCEFLYELLGKYHIDKNDKLTKENIVTIKEVILQHEDTIIEHFSPMINIAKNYIKDYINDCKNICLIDVGWSGKSILSFENFIRKNMNYNGKVYGAMIGAFDRESTNSLISTGKLNSFMFSAHYNKDLLDIFAENYFNKTIFVETLVTSPVPSVLAFEESNGSCFDDEYDIVYGNAMPENNDAIKSIHEGIMDFADMYYSVIKKHRDVVKIQAADAFMPINCFSNHKQWIEYTFADYKFDLLSGFGNSGIQDYLPNILH